MCLNTEPHTTSCHLPEAVGEHIVERVGAAGSHFFQEAIRGNQVHNVTAVVEMLRSEISDRARDAGVLGRSSASQRGPATQTASAATTPLPDGLQPDIKRQEGCSHSCPSFPKH